MRDRGQALPLLLVVLALATAAALVIAEVGVAEVERARAQQAADAAALAGAAAGPDAAEAAAAANGAELIGYWSGGSLVEVEVRYRRAVASATAEVLGVPYTSSRVPRPGRRDRRAAPARRPPRGRG